MEKIKKIIAFWLTFLLFFQQAGFAQVAAELDVAGHLVQLHQALTIDRFRPLHLRYLNFDPQAHTFRLLLDKGNVPLLTQGNVRSSSRTLLEYFFIGLALPNQVFWVNLRPDSSAQIIDVFLGQTDLGRIMLETDLQLKKDVAMATSPDTAEGKVYWDKLYQKAGELFGNENITIPTLTRPWIVPDEIIVRETADSAYIYKATMKVMLEQDFLKDSATYNFKDARLKALNEYSSQLIRELIIPKISREVNSSKRYASLRQVYYSLIMAQWFKARYKNIPNDYRRFIDAKDLTQLTSTKPWSKETYFKEYQKSFKDGEYNIQVPAYTASGKVIRSYFSGGQDFARIGAKIGEKAFPVPKAVPPQAVQGAGSPVVADAPAPGQIAGVTVDTKLPASAPEIADATTNNLTPAAKPFSKPNILKRAWLRTVTFIALSVHALNIFAGPMDAVPNQQDVNNAKARLEYVLQKEHAPAYLPGKPRVGLWQTGYVTWRQEVLRAENELKDIAEAQAKGKTRNELRKAVKPGQSTPAAAPVVQKAPEDRESILKGIEGRVKEAAGRVAAWRKAQAGKPATAAEQVKPGQPAKPAAPGLQQAPDRESRIKEIEKRVEEARAAKAKRDAQPGKEKPASSAAAPAVSQSPAPIITGIPEVDTAVQKQTNLPEARKLLEQAKEMLRKIKEDLAVPLTGKPGTTAAAPGAVQPGPAPAVTTPPSTRVDDPSSTPWPDGIPRFTPPLRPDQPAPTNQPPAITDTNAAPAGTGAITNAPAPTAQPPAPPAAPTQNIGKGIGGVLSSWWAKALGGLALLAAGLGFRKWLDARKAKAAAAAQQAQPPAPADKKSAEKRVVIHPPKSETPEKEAETPKKDEPAKAEPPQSAPPKADPAKAASPKPPAARVEPPALEESDAATKDEVNRLNSEREKLSQSRPDEQKKVEALNAAVARQKALVEAKKKEAEAALAAISGPEAVRKLEEQVRELGRLQENVDQNERQELKDALAKRDELDKRKQELENLLAQESVGIAEMDNQLRDIEERLATLRMMQAGADKPLEEIEARLAAVRQLRAGEAQEQLTLGETIARGEKLAQEKQELEKLLSAGDDGGVSAINKLLGEIDQRLEAARKMREAGASGGANLFREINDRLELLRQLRAEQLAKKGPQVSLGEAVQAGLKAQEEKLLQAKAELKEKRRAKVQQVKQDVKVFVDELNDLRQKSAQAEEAAAVATRKFDAAQAEVNTLRQEAEGLLAAAQEFNTRNINTMSVGELRAALKGLPKNMLGDTQAMAEAIAAERAKGIFVSEKDFLERLAGLMTGPRDNNLARARKMLNQLKKAGARVLGVEQNAALADCRDSLAAYNAERDRLAAMQKELQAEQEVLAGLPGKIAAAEKAVLEARIAGLNKAIAEIDGSTVELSKKKAGLEQKVAELRELASRQEEELAAAAAKCTAGEKSFQITETQRIAEEIIVERQAAELKKELALKQKNGETLSRIERFRLLLIARQEARERLADTQKALSDNQAEIAQTQAAIEAAPGKKAALKGRLDFLINLPPRSEKMAEIARIRDGVARKVQELEAAKQEGPTLKIYRELLASLDWNIAQAEEKIAACEGATAAADIEKIENGLRETVQDRLERNHPEQIQFGKAGYRKVVSAESRAYIAKGGWKLHLTVKPENYEAVDRWLFANHPGQYKLLSGREPGEADFTVYIGSRDEAEALAQKLEKEIGALLENSNAGASDQLLTPKVAARFDIQHTDIGRKHDLVYYGINGIPFDKRAIGDVHLAHYESRKQGKPFKDVFDVQKHLQRIEPILIKEFGEYYTGTKKVPTASSAPEAALAKSPAELLAQQPYFQEIEVISFDETGKPYHTDQAQPGDVIPLQDNITEISVFQPAAAEPLFLVSLQGKKLLVQQRQPDGSMQPVPDSESKLLWREEGRIVLQLELLFLEDDDIPPGLKILVIGRPDIRIAVGEKKAAPPAKPATPPPVEPPPAPGGGAAPTPPGAPAPKPQAADAVQAAEALINRWIKIDQGESDLSDEGRELTAKLGYKDFTEAQDGLKGKKSTAKLNADEERLFNILQELPQLRQSSVELWGPILEIPAQVAAKLSRVAFAIWCAVLDGKAAFGNAELFERMIDGLLLHGAPNDINIAEEKIASAAKKIAEREKKPVEHPDPILSPPFRQAVERCKAKVEAAKAKAGQEKPKEPLSPSALQGGAPQPPPAPGGGVTPASPRSPAPGSENDLSDLKSSIAEYAKALVVTSAVPFKNGEVNSDEAIKSITAIGGNPLAEINRRARKGGYSQSGFADDVIAQMLIDNQKVKALGVNHSDLGNLLLLALDFYAQHGWQEFEYNGMRMNISVMGTHGMQQSIFINGQGWGGGNSEFFITNLTQGTRLKFTPGNVAEILALGFYEAPIVGGDKNEYAVDPELLWRIFNDKDYRKPYISVEAALEKQAEKRKAAEGWDSVTVYSLEQLKQRYPFAVREVPSRHPGLRRIAEFYEDKWKNSYDEKPGPTGPVFFEVRIKGLWLVIVPIQVYPRGDIVQEDSGAKASLYEDGVDIFRDGRPVLVDDGYIPEDLKNRAGVSLAEVFQLLEKREKTTVTENEHWFYEKLKSAGLSYEEVFALAINALLRRNEYVDRLISRVKFNHEDYSIYQASGGVLQECAIIPRSEIAKGNEGAVVSLPRQQAILLHLLAEMTPPGGPEGGAPQPPPAPGGGVTPTPAGAPAPKPVTKEAVQAAEELIQRSIQVEQERNDKLQLASKLPAAGKYSNPEEAVEELQKKRASGATLTTEEQQLESALAECYKLFEQIQTLNEQILEIPVEAAAKLSEKAFFEWHVLHWIRARPGNPEALERMIDVLLLRGGIERAEDGIGVASKRLLEIGDADALKLNPPFQAAINRCKTKVEAAKARAGQKKPEGPPLPGAPEGGAPQPPPAPSTAPALETKATPKSGAIRTVPQALEIFLTRDQLGEQTAAEIHRIGHDVAALGRLILGLAQEGKNVTQIITAINVLTEGKLIHSAIETLRDYAQSVVSGFAASVSQPAASAPKPSKVSAVPDGYINQEHADVARAYLEFLRQQTSEYPISKFQAQLNKYLPDAQVSEVYRSSGAQDKDTYWTFRRESSPQRYWLIETAQGNFIMPRPVKPDRFDDGNKPQGFELEEGIAPDNLKGIIPVVVVIRRNYDNYVFKEGDLAINSLRVALKDKRLTNKIALEILGMDTAMVDYATEADLLKAFNIILTINKLYRDIGVEQYEARLSRGVGEILARARNGDVTLTEVDYVRLNRALLEAVYPQEIVKAQRERIEPITGSRGKISRKSNYLGQSAAGQGAGAPPKNINLWPGGPNEDTYGGILPPDKTAVPTAPAATGSGVGGIYFANLPIVTQAMGNLKSGMNPGSLAHLKAMDLAGEWQVIEKMVKAEIIPSGERLKEYVQAACVQNCADADFQKVVGCIAEVFKFDEECCRASDPLLRDILITVEAAPTVGQLKTVLVG